MLLFFIIFFFTLGLVPFVYLNTVKVEMKPIMPAYSVEYTNWVASDGSEMVFDDDEFKWYQYEGEYEDNYYSGTYEFYIGEDAVYFITTDLAKYSVTEAELNDLFEKNELYSIDNFVVFNLEYDSLVVGGEASTMDESLIPWYGFILEDGTYLDVANMNTGTYYKFNKK